jgi:ATP-dependent DNA ligase
MMAVFRAQVSISEQKITALERELKLLKPNTYFNTNPNSKSNSRSNLHSLLTDNNHSDSDNLANLNSENKRIKAQEGMMTDESDEKWSNKHNPLLTDQKSSNEAEKKSDRLLTLSRVSMQGRQGDRLAYHKS